MNRITIIKEFGEGKGVEFQVEDSDEFISYSMSEPIEFLDSYGVLDDEEYFFAKTEYLDGSDGHIHGIERVSLFNEFNQKMSSWIIVKHEFSLEEYVSPLEFYGQVYLIILKNEHKKRTLI